MILGVCDNSSMLETVRIVRIIIRVITIIVPILLLVSLSISFTKGVTSNEGSNKKVYESVVKKLVAAIVIFLLPTFVGIIVNISSDDFSYKDCFTSSTLEGIQKAKIKEASVLVNYALKTLSVSDYEQAVMAVRDLDDGNEKTQLTNKLASISKTIKLKQQVDAAYLTGTEEDYNKLIKEVNVLSASSAKNDMLAKLKKMKERIDASKTPDVDKTISDIGAETPPLNKVNNKNITLNYYKASTGQGFSYWLYVPENAGSDLPIVIYIHGLGERGDDYHKGTTMGINSGPIREINRGTKKYEAIIIQPQIPSNDKSQNYGRAIVELTTKLAKGLNGDMKRISISGFSNGCYGVFAIVSQFPSYFSAAVGMGCTPSNANSFKTTPLWTFVGSGDGVSTMPSFVEQVKRIHGGQAWHTQVPHHAHNIVSDTNYSVFVEYKVVEWMIGQKRN